MRLYIARRIRIQFPTTANPPYCIKNKYNMQSRVKLATTSITLLILVIIHGYNSLQYIDSTPMYSRQMVITWVKIVTPSVAIGTHTHKKVKILLDLQVIMRTTTILCTDIWVYNNIPP